MQDGLVSRSLEYLLLKDRKIKIRELTSQDSVALVSRTQNYNKDMYD